MCVCVIVCECRCCCCFFLALCTLFFPEINPSICNCTANIKAQLHCIELRYVYAWVCECVCAKFLSQMTISTLLQLLDKIHNNGITKSKQPFYLVCQLFAYVYTLYSMLSFVPHQMKSVHKSLAITMKLDEKKLLKITQDVLSMNSPWNSCWLVKVDKTQKNHTLFTMTHAF